MAGSCGPVTAGWGLGLGGRSGAGAPGTTAADRGDRGHRGWWWVRLPGAARDRPAARLRARRHVPQPPPSPGPCACPVRWPRGRPAVAAPQRLKRLAGEGLDAEVLNPGRLVFAAHFQQPLGDAMAQSEAEAQHQPVAPASGRGGAQSALGWRRRGASGAAPGGWQHNRQFRCWALIGPSCWKMPGPGWGASLGMPMLPRWRYKPPKPRR